MRLICVLAAWLVLVVPLAIVGCGGAPTATSDPTNSGGAAAAGKTITLLNVSYDPTREFYQQYNQAFAKHWLAEHGDTVIVQQSHGGSGKQARAVIDGLEADVVTLSVGIDIDAIAEKSQLVDSDWQSRLPHQSAPYTSTIVFLVRKGNPKQIRDWPDLVQGDISLVAANPKTGGGARWNYLAAWGAALQRELGDDWKQKLHDPAQARAVEAAQHKAREYVGELYRRMKVLDSGARGATNSFVQRGIGDVLLAWENEAFLTLNELGVDQVEIVVPSVSILAAPAVAVVDRNVEKHKTRTVATEYLQWLFSETGQTLAAEFYFRPALPELVEPTKLKKFADVELFTIEEVFGAWPATQKVHFDGGGIFDQIYQPGQAK